MNSLKVLKHIKGAPGMRYFGLGPNLTPLNSLKKLQKLLADNTEWGQNRSLKQLKKCLSRSDIIVSIWEMNKLIGFGRATSDGIFRATLWDIVINKEKQGLGIGKLLVNTLLDDISIIKVERIYIMTTKKKEFYLQLGFRECNEQNLMIKK